MYGAIVFVILVSACVQLIVRRLEDGSGQFDLGNTLGVADCCLRGVCSS